MTNADGNAERAGTLLAVGAPNAGKTQYALRALLEGIRRYGADRALMAVSGRKAADALADRVIREIGASSEVRPVTTLPAIAFRLIAAVRRRAGQSAPRLLNGAEQDALLRRVTAVHVRHAAVGETGDCATCALLAAYFASERWNDLVLRPDADAGASATDRLFERGIGDAFIDQLRDMLARMNELGASGSQEERIIAALADDVPPADPDSGRSFSPSPASVLRCDRLAVQWRLAFALRREYVRAIGADYPGEYRLDSSRLLVEGTDAVRMAHPDDLPRLVAVDDVQDLTLAGLAFLEALRDAGCALTLTGNPDESVQSFRGSYPEYVLARIRGWQGLQEIRLDGGRPVAGTAADGGKTDGRTGEPQPVAPRYLDLVAARASLSILSEENDPLPLVRRPGKLPAWAGALPIAPQQSPSPSDGSLTAGLYRSPREEADDVIWRIRREHLESGRAWNDMAVIAHDNATVRAIGERLRREGVPVTYSSVTRPLKDEPFVAGLFAIVELARFGRKGLTETGMSLRAAAGYVRSRVAAVMNSPLVAVGASDRSEGYPARLSVAESAMDSLQSLAGVIAGGASASESLVDAADTADAADAADAGGDLARLVARWQVLRDALLTERRRIRAERAEATAIEYGGGTDADEPLEFGRDALYLMLACGNGNGEDAGDGDGNAAAVLRAIGAVCGGGPGGPNGHAEAFERVWRIVDATARGMDRLADGRGRGEAQYVLSAAWQACGVDRRWQRLALANDEAGRAANDRLDVAMRLFQFAADATAERDVAGFMAQVRAMQVEADSLARVAPVEQAVTLTTPAGAAGRHWDLVWIPAVQQDVWPNLASRNTMFGGEDLADIMLRGRLVDAGTAPGAGVRSPRLAAVLYAETRSLLVALTRVRSAAYVSAVRNDELAPSDFLYELMPERYPRGDDPHYTPVGGGSAYAGLENDPRGLVAVARMTLARAAMEGTLDGGRARDAARALAWLASHGVTAADPDRWAFVPRDDRSQQEHEPAASEPDGTVESADRATSPRLISLSPSAVDGLWACPVCWLLENRFAGPRRGGAAAGFGTLMHAVAEQASREGLDLPERGLAAEAIAARMEEIYAGLRPDTDAIDDVRERYVAARRDAEATGMIANIAAYFAESNGPDYPPRNAGNIAVGRLARADCELEFAARFGFDDILAAYNAIDGMTPIDRPTLTAIMGSLVGGWPEAIGGTGADPSAADLTVRLSGRIDRAETRILADGTERLRLIDYKTGGKPGTPQLFSDLQLVCYQLGVTFPEGGPRGLDALRRAPVIAQSELFHVADGPYPAASYGAESAYQPPLFARGSLNAEPFAPRYWFKSPQRLFDVSGVLAGAPPQGVAPDDWERFVALRGTQAVWALTMIARVFYAAAASVSARITAHPQPDHVRHCRCLGVCPACSGQIDTVFETRQA